MIVIRRIHVSAGVASQMQGLHRPAGTIGQICLCCSWKKWKHALDAGIMICIFDPDDIFRRIDG